MSLALLPWFLTTACNSFTLVSRIELSVLTDRNAKAEQPCAYATDSLSNLLLSSTRLVPRGVIPHYDAQDRGDDRSEKPENLEEYLRFHRNQHQRKWEETSEYRGGTPWIDWNVSRMSRIRQ